MMARDRLAELRLSVSQFAPFVLRADREGSAMDHSHHSKVFGLSMAAALGLMLILSALAQSAAPKIDDTREAAGRILGPR
jgi:hypothetical protein